MKIVIVRPVISQVRALMTQEKDTIAIPIWEINQDPSLSEKDILANQDINWISWHPPKYKLISFINKILFFKKIIDSYEVKILHLNGLRDTIQVYFARIISNQKPKIILTSRNSYLWFNPKKNRLIGLFLNKFSDGYVALSSKNKNQLIELGFPEKKICFIPNAFNHFEFSINNDNSTVHKNKVRIIYVASVIRNKSQTTLIESVHNINNQNFELLLIGSTEQDPDYHLELKNKIVNLELENVVKILGKLSHNEVIKYYISSDIVVFPSISEMMPRAVIEAMWFGKPVIASAIDGILDLIKDKETGLLCNPADKDDFSKAILFLIENPNEGVRIGKAGQKYVQEFCSLEVVGKKYLEFYEQILNSY